MKHSKIKAPFQGLGFFLVFAMLLIFFLDQEVFFFSAFLHSFFDRLRQTTTTRPQNFLTVFIFINTIARKFCIKSAKIKRLRIFSAFINKSANGLINLFVVDIIFPNFQAWSGYCFPYRKQTVNNNIIIHGLDRVFWIIGGAPTYVLTENVPRNIFVVMSPPSLCAGPAVVPSRTPVPQWFDDSSGGDGAHNARGWGDGCFLRYS